MPKITYPNKQQAVDLLNPQPNEVFTPTDANMVKEVVNRIDDLILLGQSGSYLGVAVPTTNPGTPATKVFYVATQPGTYTNFGGAVVNASSFAVLAWSGSAWVISQNNMLTGYALQAAVDNEATARANADLLKVDKVTGKGLSTNDYDNTEKARVGKIPVWVAGAYPSGSQVNSLGKDWTANADTLSTDVPGTSSKWVERLTGYLDKSTIQSAATKNLFNKDAAVTGQFIQNNTGSIIVLANAKTSEQIPVTASTQYTISNLPVPTAGNLAIRYENSSHGMISYLALTAATTTFTTPVGCVYIVIGLYRNDSPTDFSLAQLELGAVATSFSLYAQYTTQVNNKKLLAEYINTDLGVKTLMQYLADKFFVSGSPSLLKTELGDRTLQQYVTDKGVAVATQTAVTGKNLFNKAAVFTDMLINSADGVYKAAVGFTTSSLIDVLPDTDYYISGRTTVYANLAYYDINKALIPVPPYGYATWNSGQPVNGLYHTTPATYYVRFIVLGSAQAGSLNAIQFEKGSAATAYEAFTSEMLINKINGIEIYAKKSKSIDAVVPAPSTLRVVAFGDSITARTDNWTTTFNQIISPLTLTNMGISGAQITWAADTVETTNPVANTAPNNVLWNQIKKWEATTPITPTAFIIAMGTNDLSPFPTGSMSAAFAQDLASTSQLTMANALRKALQYLINLYPNTQIFLCTPIQSKVAARNWTILKDISTVLIDVAKRLDVRVIDCFNESGIVDEYEVSGGAGRYLSDGTHPNAAGAAKHGKYIAKEFSKIYIS